MVLKQGHLTEDAILQVQRERPGADLRLKLASSLARCGAPQVGSVTSWVAMWTAWQQGSLRGVPTCSNGSLVLPSVCS